MSYFAGIDLGTSGVKSVLFDERGKIIASAGESYELIQPRNGWAEQRPADWENAVIKTLRAVSSSVPAEEIKGVGTSGQMHGLVPLGKNGEPLCNGIIWCDQRTDKEVGEIAEVFGKENYLKETLNAPNSAFTLAKLLWIKNNRPEIFSKIDRVLLPKDYINFRLTGGYSTDKSDASGTGYFNVAERRTSEKILNAFKIPLERTADAYESPEPVGTVSRTAAEATGLSEKTVVAAGAGDQAAAALGNGILREGETSVSLGTSGVVFSATNKPKFDKNGGTHTFCHAVPSMWHIMGVTQACGLSVSWFKNNFANGRSFKELEENARNVSSDGVIYLPYLMGERTPYLDPNCRGSFTGLGASCGVFSLYRALLEGVCFSLRDCCDLIRLAGIDFSSARVCGGGAKSGLWLQILADVTGVELSVAENPESGALGVAVLGAVASGAFKDVGEAYENMGGFRASRVFVPDKSKTAEYDESFKKYKALYPAIKKALEPA